MTIERQMLLLLERGRLPESDGIEGGTKSSDQNQLTRVPAQEIYVKLKLICQQAISHADWNVGELLVRTAEVAIHQGDFDTATEASRAFFYECKAKNQVHNGSYVASSNWKFLSDKWSVVVLLQSTIGASSMRISRRTT